MGVKCFGLQSVLWMKHEAVWRLFNVDSIAEEVTGDQRAATIDLCVASLAFKNFDFVAKRLPFLVECSTYDPFTWCNSSIAPLNAIGFARQLKALPYMPRPTIAAVSGLIASM